MTAIITVHGGLTAAPELKFTNSGTPLVTGTVASTERYRDRQTGEFKDGKKLYARFTAWGPLAENIAASALDKGAQVAVTGKLHTHEYRDKDGNNRSSTELELIDFAASLKHATVAVTRVQAQQGAGAGFGAGSAPQVDPWSSAPQNGAQGGFSDQSQFPGFDEERPF